MVAATKRPVRFDEIEARYLRIHPIAQRENTVKVNIKRIADNLDLDAIGTVHAVEYHIHGEFATWIVDGQHRIKALLERGLGEWPVTVMIHEDVKDDAAASALFLRLNTRTPVNSNDHFRNEVQSGNPAAVHITHIARKHGFEIRGWKSNEVLACPKALKFVHGLDHGDALDHTLSVIVAAFGHTVASNEGILIEGIGRVFAANHGRVDKAALVSRLAKFPGGAPAIIGNARSFAAVRKIGVSKSLSEYITELYNKGRSTHRLQLP